MYYIGIDVHSKKCMTTIKGRTKDILKQTEFDNDVQGIDGFIRMIRQEGYVSATAVCESTGNYWIVPHDMLEEAGINTLLAHPHNTKIITQTVYKNDRADSEKLADLCRLDMVPESFVANKAQRDLRELTRTRLELQDGISAPKNRIHAILAKYPHKRPVKGLFTDRGLEWLKNWALVQRPRRHVHRCRYRRLQDNRNIAAQNPALDSQNPTYGIGSGADSAFFAVNGVTIVIKPSEDYSGKAQYAVNITLTGDFGTDNFRMVGITATGAGNAHPPSTRLQAEMPSGDLPSPFWHGIQTRRLPTRACRHSGIVITPFRIRPSMILRNSPSESAPPTQKPIVLLGSVGTSIPAPPEDTGPTD